MARVLLRATGGIAAYKAAELCRLLVKAGHDVVPVLTSGAERFVTAETFRALSRAGRRPRARTRISSASTSSLIADPDREHAGQARIRDRRQRPHGGSPRP